VSAATGLRPYQARAVDAAIEWMRQSIEPFIIEAATGAGKSHIIAAVAATIHQRTGKRVLCLAPSAELVTQNRAKYIASGHPCSMFSASAGAKELRHPVVFGSPLTVKNRISRFRDGYALVVIDEAHGITPTVREIVEAMRAGNPNLRVMGLTATPYRLGSGYIFRRWPDGRVNGDATARDPYFTACVDVVGARELIAAGYLTLGLSLGRSMRTDTTRRGLLPMHAGNLTQMRLTALITGMGERLRGLCRT
jgi:DNA repair protein RadD